MSLSAVIQKIFNQNTNYADAQQAVNQAASLKYLSSDLYSDSKRFIYELLQNADDSSVSRQKLKIAIRLFDNKLVVAHTGKEFDNRDVRGISSVDDGTKKDAIDKTGFKGIGFKSVFGQSDHVVVYSKSEYFRFDADYKHEWKTIWGESQYAWETETGRKFEMPWQLIPIPTDASDVDGEINKFLTCNGWTVGTIITLRNVPATVKAVEELAGNVNMFLFLKNISSINLHTGKSINIDIREDSESRVELIVDGHIHAAWLKKTVTLGVPAATTQKLANDKDVPEKLKKATRVDLSLAAKLTEEGISQLHRSEQLLYAYLPTEESDYRIPVLVNAAFYTVASREALHRDSAWNEWLFECVAKELFQWIAQLAQQGKYDCYNLLPTKLLQNDHLAIAYNQSFAKAVQEIPFVINRDKKLVKFDEAIIDFTGLSEKAFIGPGAVKNFMIEENGLMGLAENPFVLNASFGSKLKALKVAFFDWSHVPKLLGRPDILPTYSAANETALISHLKAVSENEKMAEVNDSVLKDWPFILNQNGDLKTPKEVFFPSPIDAPDTSNRLSFIHPDLKQWLQGQPEVKNWLEGLGVVEKSDLTYLEKTIIPQAATYITRENAFATIRQIFQLFLKGEVNIDILLQLRPLKLLTEQNNLVTASDCYLSASYHPRLSIHGALTQDLYVSSDYKTEGETVSHWKYFFLQLGVREEIGLLRCEEQLGKSVLIGLGFNNSYFNHQYTPVYSTFNADEYKDVSTLTMIDYTVGNVAFSKIYWKDVIETINVTELARPATAFWGNPGRPGRTSGNQELNYTQWYVSNMPCLPTTTGTCQEAGEVFLNEPETLSIAGNYLPVFDGPALNPDWRAFFNFKTRLKLEDYLFLLTKVSEDQRGDNKTRIQSIYNYLLENFLSWSTQEQELVQEWANTGRLADSTGAYRHTADLKYYADGDFSIFGNSFHFIQLSRVNQQHPQLENLLGLFGIAILRQGEFKLNTSDDVSPSSLKTKLGGILPYWAKWIEKAGEGQGDEILNRLLLRLKELEIMEARELSISYGEGWSKKVNVHHLDNTLYVLSPWDSAKVMYSLPDKLCEIFEVKKYSQEVTFLLRSDVQELTAQFEEEGIALPAIFEGPADGTSASPAKSLITAEPDLFPKARTDYQHYWDENEKRNAELVTTYGIDPEALLVNGLKAHYPSGELSVYHFSHIENAVSIIREAAIKSRRDAVFQDSAGSGIIAQTDKDRKAFARFYFRPKTPTQFYVENLGRGEESQSKIGSDPLCPVPVFFVVPLEEAIANSDWQVSLGTLASSQVEFGNDTQTLSKFDFEGVYANIGQIAAGRFLIAAHQEFLVKEQLDLSKVNYRLVVQDDEARKCLIAMLGDDGVGLESRITVDGSFYNGENPRVKLEKSDSTVAASLSKPHDGHFILQHAADQPWEAMKGQITKQYHDGQEVTSFAGASLSLKGKVSNSPFKLFYSYKGRNWLVHTNTADALFKIDFVKAELRDWFEGADHNVPGLFTALKAHPELAYWFEQPLGGPDALSLEEHTKSVIENYLLYFAGRQTLFHSDKEYLLCLALHDIGKPRAVVQGDMRLQHQFTLEAIDRLHEILPLDEHSLNNMKLLINADPVGKYLNAFFNQALSVSRDEIESMSKDAGMKTEEFFNTLTLYYQCDAAGYNSLRNRLFLPVEDRLILTADGSRLLFSEEYETKFKALWEMIEIW